MRKTVILLLLVVTIFLAGCDSGDDENANVNPAGTTAGGSPVAVTPAASTVDIQKLSSVGKSKAGGIDSVNGHVAADPTFGRIDTKQTTDVAVSGWTIDDQTQKPAEGVFLSVDGTQDFPATYGIDRKDVADYFKNDAIRFSGFKASIPAAKLAKGRHSLTLKTVKGDKSAYYESERTVNIEIK